MNRGQSNVVGVALLLGVTVVALGSLTASIGAMVDQNAAAADATRVASDMDRALDPVTVTGTDRGRVSFTQGKLRTVERELRMLDDDGVVRTVRADGLVFTAGNRRVAYVAGAVVQGRPNHARMYAQPPITTSRDEGVLVVGAAKLNASSRSIVSDTGTSVLLRTDVTHHRKTFESDGYRVAVETETPEPWTRYFERLNATTATRDFDDDGVTSVVARFPGERTAYVVVHDMRTEVADG